MGDDDVSNFIPTPLDRVLALLLPVLDYKTALFSVVRRVERDQVHTWCGVACLYLECLWCKCSKKLVFIGRCL